MSIQKSTDAFQIVQTAGDTYQGNDADQIYQVSPTLTSAGDVITIIDQGGSNTIELAGGLTIASSIVTSNETQLTLSNGAVINVRGADTFTFSVGANTAAGQTGVDKTFSEFATDVLGVTLPAADEPAVTSTSGVNIDDGGTVTPTDPVDPNAPTYTLTAGADSVDEGTTATFSLATTNVAEGTEVAYTISGVDAADVTGDLTGTATVAADGTATISVALAADMTTEDAETLTVAIDGQTATASSTVNDTSLSSTFTLTSDAAADQILEGVAVTYTLTASQPVTEDTVVTFSVAASDASAADAGTNTTNLNDFAGGTFNPVTATIAAGSTTATFTVTGSNDGITELPESYSVSAVVGDVTTTTTTSMLDGAGTFRLTNGIDELTGTDFDDIFNANEAVAQDGTTKTATLTAVDNIDGKDGNDTLNLSSTSDVTVPASATVANIETANISSAEDVVADVSGWTGLTTLNVTGAGIASTAAAGAVTLTAAATTDVNITGVADNSANNSNIVTDVTGGKSVTVTQAMKNVASTLTVDKAVDVDITVTDLATDGTDSAVIVGTATADAATGTVSVSTSGAKAVGGTGAIALDNVVVKGGTTVSVTETATSDMGDIATAGTGTDAVSLGNVTVTGTAATTQVTVTQDEEVSAVAAVAAVAGVAETNVVTFAAITSGQAVAVDGLVFTASKDLTAAQVAAAFSNLVKSDLQEGGITANGIYSGTLSANWTSGAATDGATTSTVTFSEVTPSAATTAFDVTTGTTATALATPVNTAGVAAVTGVTGVLGVVNGAVVIDDDATASITTITVDGYGADATLGGGGSLDALTSLSLANSDTGTVALTSSATTLGLTVNDVDGTLTLGSNLTTLNLTASTVNSLFTGITAASLATLNVSGDATVTTTSNLAALTTVTVSGSAGLTLASANSASLTSIDTSGTTGTTTATIDAGNATYTGGAGMDMLTTATTTAPTKAITLGAGNDKVTLASGTTAMGTAGTIDAGADTDMLSMAAADAVTASGSTTFAGVVTNFEQLEITGATGTQSIDAGKLGGYNYVNVLSAAAGAQTTVTGLTSGATILLRDGDANTTTDRVIVDITDAATNSADVLNIELSALGTNTAMDDSGIVAAANVETINISSTDNYITTPNVAAAEQRLTLEAAKAQTVTITGDASLTLTNTGNTALTAIDASAFTGVLTVAAAGTVGTTITGGTGNDVLTASAGGSGASVAQVSTITLTDGTNTGLTTADTMAVSVGGTAFTYTSSGTETMDTAGAGLAALINANGAYGASYNATTDAITVTAAVAGTAFDLAGYAVTDAGGTVNATGSTATAATPTAAIAQAGTFAFTGTEATDGADETFTTTITDTGGTATFVTTIAAGAGAAAATVSAVTHNATGTSNQTYTVGIVGGVVTITAGTAGEAFTATTAATSVGGTQDITVGAYTPTQANVDQVSTYVLTDGTANAGLDIGDTLSITLTSSDSGADTFTHTVTAANETMDSAATALAVLIQADTSYASAAYNASTDTMTITSANNVAVGGVFTTGAYSLVDVVPTVNTTGASAAFATTTANVSTTGASDTLIGGAGNDTLTAGHLATLTGGAGDDTFNMNVLSTNVNSYATITDFSSGDVIDSAATAFDSSGISLASTAVFQDYANAAVNQTDAGDLTWFQFGTDTFVIDNNSNGASFDAAQDMIIRITGLVDLENAASFNSAQGTLELV